MHEILLEIARNHPLALKNPEPFVLFANFGPTALEFEVRVFLSDINSLSSVQNDIRFAIVEKFAEAGISIPSTPRLVETRSWPKWPTDDDKEEALYYEAEQARAKQAAEARPRRRSKRPDPD